MNNKQAYSDEDRHSSDRYTEDFESDDGKRTSTPKRLSPKKASNHQYYQDKFRSRGRHSGTLKSHNQARGLKRGRGNTRGNTRGNNSRSSEPADMRKSHDNVTSRVLSASRNRINGLRNQVEELNIQIRDLQQENRLYKKMQFRQEKAIRGLEDKENDLPAILDRHNNEVRALREQNKRLKEKYEKSDRYLRDAEDELEKMKTKLKKYKDMCEQQELKEREELSKKLTQAQLDLEEKEVKLKELQRYIDMLKKNHRHELGIEVARQKEMKKQVEELTEKNSLLENQLKEKERALDYLNIYSNPQQGRPSRDSSPDGSTVAHRSKKKASAVGELTPRDKAKFYSEKRRLELFRQKELKEEKERKKKEQWEKEEREKEKNTLSSSSQQFVFGNKDQIFDESEELRLEEEEKRQRQDRENRERRDEELLKRQRDFEKRQEQDNLDRMSKENREKKEREERDKREQRERDGKRQEETEGREKKEREEKARKEVEKREQHERERWQEEERKMERERKEILEEERKQREKVEQEKRIQAEKEKLESDPLWQAERKKKDELLKKIQQTNEQGSVDADPFSPLSSKKGKGHHFHSGGVNDTSDSQGRKGETKEYSFTQPINNMHRGKPAHEDVTVPYLERQKQRRRTSDDSGGYEPSFGPARGEGNKAHKTKPTPLHDDDDEPLFKLPANTTSSSATKQHDKKPANLLETLFGPQASNPNKTSTNAVKENDLGLSRKFSHPSSNQIKTADATKPPYHHSNPPSSKSRPDFDKKSTIFGGGALIEDEFSSNGGKVLPRRHRESNLNTFSAKPSVTAIDTFDDEIEEFVL